MTCGENKKAHKSRITGYWRQDDTFINFFKRTQHAPFLTANLPFFRKGFVGGGAILIFLIVGVLFLGGCKPKQTIVEVKYETHYIDSVRLKDSIVLVPTERIVDIVPWYDTLHLVAEFAYSDAWIDTNYNIIQGQLVTKQGKLVEIRYMDRWRTRDSIVEREVPVPYEVEVIKTHIPTWAWFCLGCCIIGLGLVVWRLYRRFFYK